VSVGAKGVPVPEGVDAARVGRVCAVTGAAGYVGSWLVPTLRALGCEVRALDRVDAPPGFEGTLIRGDIRVRAAIDRLVAGADTVFHLAAVIELRRLVPASVRDEVVAINVGGVTGLIDACRAAGVKRLVDVSSNNVCIDGDRVEQDETAPYAARTWDLYTATKIEAERLVLAANGESLRTCAVRPGGIWGPGEGGYMVREFLAAAAKGQFVVRLGDGRATGDNTHVFSLVRALVQAAAALERPEMGGRAWFVTDDERFDPIEWFRPIAEHFEVAWPKRSIPGPVAWAMATASEWAHRAGGPRPFLTRGGLLKILTRTSFRIDAARRDLGYEPWTRRDAGLAEAMPDLERVYAGFRGQR